MSTKSLNTSFAVFGSAARGDNDLFSDRDLLVVSDGGPRLREMKSACEAAGWSCTAYSWGRLQRASDQGSLFVQHLKQESKVLRDPSERLSQLLTRFSPKPDYKREAFGAASLLGNLLQELPQCHAGPMWTLDVLSAGFRSLAVANLADHGIYVFANSEIIDGLIRIGMLRREDGYQLRSLRQFKSLYRRGIIDKRVKWCEIYDWIRLVDRTFAMGLSSRCVQTMDILDLALADANTESSGADWYSRCRRIESALWMLKPKDRRNYTEFLEHRSRLFRIVKAPNIYAWHFASGYATVQHSLAELAEMSAV